MDTVAIELMQDFSEIVHYEHTGIPLYIRTADLTVYPGMSAPCHWHDDIEWIYIISGKMYYYINGKRILLDVKDSLMVNARQMHYGYSYKKQDCHFLCILFHPSLFGGNKTLLQKYVTPVIENADCEYLHFHSEQARGREIAEYLEQIRRLKEEAADAYEMQAVAVMFQLWSNLLQCGELVIEDSKSESNSDLEIQKNMVSFIPASNKPSSRASADIWRMPRGALCASGTRFAPTETECRPNTPPLGADLLVTS